MPKTPTPLWLSTWALVITQPIVIYIFYWNLGISGRLHADGDSIGIPIIGNLVVWMLVAPFLLFFTWLMLRRYNPNNHLFAWDRCRPIRSSTASISLGGCAIAFIVLSTIDLGTACAWYEHMLAIYQFFWTGWLLAMRAVVVGQLPTST
jgi:hypothetical protein